jgi:asparagine synthase (glutamine-hydrolysing)
MLVKVDRMSMAHSLEVRAPFLDHRLIELMVRTHKDVKMRGMERKSILRRTVARRLPPALLEAPKKGFAVPIGDWFKGQDFVERSGELLRPGGVDVHGDVVRRIVEQNRVGAENYGNLIWILTILDRVVRSA